MHDHEDDEDCDMTNLDAKFSPWDIVIAFFAFWHGVGQAFGNALEILLQAAVAAGNREVRQERFQEEAALAIESIPVTDGEDG